MARAAKSAGRASDEPITDVAGLIASVRRELELHDRQDTVAGQLALALASQVTAVGGTGIAGLSKELRQVMTEALSGVISVEDEPEDEVDKARRAREYKAREAARRA